MRIITSDTMRSIDHKTISKGYVEGKILMERAGRGAALEVLKFTSLLNPVFCSRYVIVCGKGNNGGDGYVMASELIDKGKQVKIYSVCNVGDLSGDALYHAKKIKNQVEIEVISGSVNFENSDFIIDCLLGTGLNSDVREPYTSIINSINGSGCAVASVDIASGLNGNDGKVHGVAVTADITLTVGLPKTGLFINEGPEHTGRLKCLDIGFPQEIVEEFESAGELLCEHELRPFFKRRSHAAHKYKCGNVLVIGGSKNYSGAPFLTANACARSGAGMVSAAFPDSVTPSGYESLIKFSLSSSKEGTFSKKSALEARNTLNKKNVIVIGPGMTGAAEELYLIETVLKTDKTVVVDAGALIHLAENPALLERSAATVLTPHTGELSKLLQGAGLKAAAELSEKFKVHLLVKGQFSELFSPDGKSLKCATGCSALATAGSGDVLAGIIGAFLSWSKLDVHITAAHAVAVHGLCGEYLHAGTFGAIADDLTEMIPEVLKGLSPLC